MSSHSDEPDNVIRVDFRARAVVDEPVESAAVETPDGSACDDDDVVAPLRDGVEPGGAEEASAAFSEMIEAGLVLVTLDSRRDGVDVPPRFRGMAQLNLSFSHRFGIEDFTYDDQGVGASLSFNGEDYPVYVPWTAVYILRCEAADAMQVFPRNAPDELRPLIEHLLLDS